MDSKIETRLLILSDTHAADHHNPSPVAADVVIHCGDLTEESKISCHCRKHDWTLDLPTFRQKVKGAGLENDPEFVAKENGDYGEVQRLFDEARESHNIHLFDEGTHHFTLANGTKLSVFASPYTPFVDADWGFQYRLGDGHVCDIPQGEDAPDIVMTHGPPEGILDRTAAQKRLGCSHLFKAVAKSRPLVHCFGHVHAGWGAKRIAWRDNTNSILQMQRQHTLQPSIMAHQKLLTHYRVIAAANLMMKVLDAIGRLGLSIFAERVITHDGTPRYIRGTNTLFVNAAMEGDESNPFNVPWLVKIPLQKAQ